MRLTTKPPDRIGAFQLLIRRGTVRFLIREVVVILRDVVFYSVVPRHGLGTYKDARPIFSGDVLWKRAGGKCFLNVQSKRRAIDVPKIENDEEHVLQIRVIGHVLQRRNAIAHQESSTAIGRKAGACTQNSSGRGVIVPS